MALMLIIKYTMLLMSMLAGNTYKLNVIAIMHFVFILKIEDIENKDKKYELVYYAGQKLLSLKNLVLYVYINNEQDSKVVNIKIQ